MFIINPVRNIGTVERSLGVRVRPHFRTEKNLHRMQIPFIQVLLPAAGSGNHRRRIEIAVVSGIKLSGGPDLFQISFAVRAMSPVAGLTQRRQQHRSQNGDDGDHYQ
ncbi:hypothetical protein SDC9_188375 [bioreactor metagenome]|uniref:Uncharacterized protein n=1 Tax=bioreactor metagenome TaxID=1076179 RepID=A0A645HP58_9ZZZZ